jgi:uncharacterized SAM-binding protein YcdF (DUF218 family)
LLPVSWQPKVTTGAFVLSGVLLGGELVHWWSSRHRLGTRPGAAGTGEAVVVLGFGNRGDRANFLNRWRVRAGLRSLDHGNGPSRLVLSGGPVSGPESEAELMARYARDLGYTGVLITELTSQSTRENVENIVPFIEDADRIKLVSNSLHADRARGYLWRLRPDLAERLVAAADYRFGELTLLKPALAFLDLVSRSDRLRRAWRRQRGQGLSRRRGPGRGRRPGRHPVRCRWRA